MLKAHVYVHIPIPAMDFWDKLVRFNYTSITKAFKDLMCIYFGFSSCYRGLSYTCVISK